MKIKVSHERVLAEQQQALAELHLMEKRYHAIMLCMICDSVQRAAGKMTRVTYLHESRMCRGCLCKVCNNTHGGVGSAPICFNKPRRYWGFIPVAMLVFSRVEIQV